MNNKRTLSGVLPLCLVSMLQCTEVMADVVAKAAIGNKSSELIIRDRSFTPDFVTLDLSLTATVDNYFVTLNNEFSIKDDVTSYIDPDDPGFNGLVFYSREDINITLGYGFEYMTLFVGFRKGETDAHYTANNSAFGTTSDGYYVGASKSYYYKDAGALTGSIAIASLNGEVTLSEPLVDTSAFVIVAPPDNVKGSAIGLSFGIGWAGQVSDETLYNIDLKINQFDFEDDVIAGGVDLSYEENFTTIYIGMTHFF